jgi:hypothetical protein
MFSAAFYQHSRMYQLNSAICFVKLFDGTLD